MNVKKETPIINFVLENKDKFLLKEVSIKDLYLGFIWWDKYPFNFHKVKPTSKSPNRVVEVNTKIPIILLKNKDRLFVLDGMHRLKKIRDIENKKSVMAYIVPIEEVSSFLPYISKFKGGSRPLYYSNERSVG